MAPVEYLGRSWEGSSTKLHAVVDALGNCLHLDLTPGQTADCGLLSDLLAALPHAPEAVVTDKDYDTYKSLKIIAILGAETVIPPKDSRLDQRIYDENL